MGIIHLQLPCGAKEKRGWPTVISSALNVEVIYHVSDQNGRSLSRIRHKSNSQQDLSYCLIHTFIQGDKARIDCIFLNNLLQLQGITLYFMCHSSWNVLKSALWPAKNGCRNKSSCSTPVIARTHKHTNQQIYGCLTVCQIIKRMKRLKFYNEHVSFTIIRERLLVTMDLIIKHNKQRECKRKEKKWILRMQKVDLLRRGEFTSSPPRWCWGVPQHLGAAGRCRLAQFRHPASWRTSSAYLRIFLNLAHPKHTHNGTASAYRVRIGLCVKCS